MARRPEYAGLSNCVHCGLCLPACPTYVVTGDENDSPRGRLYLMRPLANESPSDPGAAVRDHLDRCLGCRACESACPAGVPYGQLLEQARFDLAKADTGPGLGHRESGPSGRFERAMLAALTGRTAGAVFAMLRAIRASGLSALVGRWIPGRAGHAARLLAASAPATLPARTGPVVPAIATPAGASRTVPAPGDGRQRDRPDRTYALLEGCVMDGLFAHTHAATRRVLARDGWAERSVPDQRCCGALHAHAGRLDRARELARHNIAAFERIGAAVVVTNSAGCGAAMREYGTWLSGDAGWRDRAEALAARTHDIMAVASTEAAAGAAGASPPAALPDRSADWSAHCKVAYDAPCHLLHGQPEPHRPLQTLAARTAIDVAPLPSSLECCGGAGTYNLRQPTLSGAVLAPKLDEILASGADVVATGNPGCIMQIGAALRNIGRSLPVVHPVELLDRYVEPGPRGTPLGRAPQP